MLARILKIAAQFIWLSIERLPLKKKSQHLCRRLEMYAKTGLFIIASSLAMLIALIIKAIDEGGYGFKISLVVLIIELCFLGLCYPIGVELRFSRKARTLFIILLHIVVLFVCVLIPVLASPCEIIDFVAP